MAKHTYYTMQKSNWQGSTWTAIAWSRTRKEANVSAKIHENDGRRTDGTIDIGAVRETIVITKTQLIREFKQDEDSALEDIATFEQDLEDRDL